MSKDISLRQAALYNLITKMSSFVIQLLITMVLSRLIAPAEFGVIAILTIVLGFLNIFADMGIGIAVIQRKNIYKEQLNSLFSTSFYIGIALALLMVLLSFPVSNFYENDIYINLFCFASLVAFFNALNIVPSALLQREKRFDKIMYRTVISMLVSGVIGIFLAFYGCGSYALLFQSISSSLMIFFWNYYHFRLSISLKVKWVEVKSLMGRYSLFQVLFNILNYFTRNLDHLLIGKFMGETKLGYYNKAYALHLYPNFLISNVITQVMHPYFKDYQDELNKMYDGLLRVVKTVSIIAVFAQLVAFICSRELILLFFGSQWGAAVMPFHALTICIWSQLVVNMCGSIFLALGRTDQTFKCSVINIVIITTVIVIGLLVQSLELLSLFVAIAYILILIITYVILIKFTLKLSMVPFLKTVYADVVVLAILSVLSEVLWHYIYIDNIVLSLIIKLVYTIGLYGFYIVVSKKYLIFRDLMAKKH